MKDKISLKRQSRRYKSESGKEHSSSSNNNGKLMKDGKVVCAIPLVECLCPDQPVIQDDPEQSVKMLCSNQSCPYSSKSYVHMECFRALEEKMYILLKHLGHKTENWTDTQIRQNLWDRKGLTLIQTQIRCPCKSGISLRDVDAWIRRENNTQKADKKRKTKKKSLPVVVTRVRCESEHAPQQYDPHEVDDYVDPALANHFSKIRLRNNSFNKASKKVSTFKLEKSPELEFPSINDLEARRTSSLCEREVKKLSFPSSYNKVVSNEIQSKMNAFESIEKPVENLEHFEMSSPYFRFDWLNHKQNESSDEGYKLF